MMKQMMAATAIVAVMGFTGAANARSGGGTHGDGNGGSGGGSGAPTEVTNNNTNNPVANGGNGTGVGVGIGYGSGGDGGAGGAGGAGGNGYGGVGLGGVGVGGGADVDNKNTNTNKNNQGQAQGQGQEQGQAQGQDQGQAQGQAQKATADNNGNAQSTNINFEAADIPVSTAYAADLVAAVNTCMGSSSAGGQGMDFGFSFGSTWQDENCAAILRSKTWESKALRATVFSNELAETLYFLSIGEMCEISNENIERNAPDLFKQVCMTEKEREVAAGKENGTVALNPKSDSKAFYNKHGWFKGENGAVCNAPTESGVCKL